MAEPLVLRDETTSPGLVVVRLGAVTLSDQHLNRSVEECHARWGIWGFSVLEVPGGDYGRLARVRPFVAARRQLFVADGAELINDGFPLLPTLDSPYWTLTLAAPTRELFARVRAHFDGPIPNPAYAPSRSPLE